MFYHHTIIICVEVAGAERAVDPVGLIITTRVGARRTYRCFYSNKAAILGSRTFWLHFSLISHFSKHFLLPIKATSPSVCFHLAMRITAPTLWSEWWIPLSPGYPQITSRVNPVEPLLWCSCKAALGPDGVIKRVSNTHSFEQWVTEVRLLPAPRLDSL